MGQFDNRTGVAFGGGYRYGPQPGMAFGLDAVEREAEKQKTITPITVIDPNKLERRLLKGKKLKKKQADS
jgi:hypothetical protein